MKEPFLGIDKPFAFRQEEDQETKALMIRHRLQSGMLSWSIKRAIKTELIKSKYPLENVVQLIPLIMEQKGLKLMLQNEVYRLHEQAVETFRNVNGWSQMQDARQNLIGTSAQRRSCMIAAARVSDVAALGGTVRAIEDGEEVVINLPRMSLPEDEDKIDVVQRARTAWIEFIQDQIISIADQLKIPLATLQHVPELPSPRNTGSRRKKRSKRKSAKSTPRLSQEFIDGAFQSSGSADLDDRSDGRVTSDAESNTEEMPKYTGVYGPSNLFEVCIKIQNPNHERSVAPNVVGWGLIKLQLKPIDIQSMRTMFHDMHPAYSQVGIDDERKEWYQKEILAKARSIQKEGSIATMVKFSRRGIPLSERPHFWKQILRGGGGGEQSEQEENTHYEMLQHETKSKRYLIDDMVNNDVKRTCDDDNYFVFEDTLHEIMKLFSRDWWISENCSLAPLSLYGVDSTGRTGAPYPPSGIIPFEGLSLMAAPFCFLYDNPKDVYFTFRNFYCRHFCRLHIVSSEQDTLVGLCKFFEDLLMEREPQVFYHLLQLNIHPLSIAFHWIFHGFAGYLKVEELLLLWDRIIGFGNLYLLPVLAAAIFWFRSKFLLRATDQQEIYDVFSDFTVIKCVPLLQLFLFN